MVLEEFLDNESIRIFLTSAHKSVNTPEALVNKSISDLIKISSMNRVFTHGFSAYRLKYITDQELLYSIRVLYKSLTKVHKNSGGVFGSVDLDVH